MRDWLDWHFSDRLKNTIIAESNFSDDTYMIQEDEERECFRILQFRDGALDPWFTSEKEVTLFDAVMECSRYEEGLYFFVRDAIPDEHWLSREEAAADDE